MAIKQRKSSLTGNKNGKWVAEGDWANPEVNIKFGHLKGMDWK